VGIKVGVGENKFGETEKSRIFAVAFTRKESSENKE
jgi:hypothetical protein